MEEKTKMAKKIFSELKMRNLLQNITALAQKKNTVFGLFFQVAQAPRTVRGMHSQKLNVPRTKKISSYRGINRPETTRWEEKKKKREKEKKRKREKEKKRERKKERKKKRNFYCLKGDSRTNIVSFLALYLTLNKPKQ
jgi:FtsZ-interacting cell division protein YlmF